MEQRDLYDINRNLTGEKIFKGDLIPKDRFIVVVLVIIQNSKGEFLIQKRSEEKEGKYAFTGGHPKSGESSLQGIITEIKEEIGLSVDKKELELIYSGTEVSHHSHFDIYYLKKDIDIHSLTLQKEEVESLHWFSLETILDLISKDMFFENHVDEVYRFIEIFKKRGINLLKKGN